MVLADVGLDRVLGVERPVAVGTRDGGTLHVFALYVPLKTMPILDLLIADVTTPVPGFQLFHL